MKTALIAGVGLGVLLGGFTSAAFGAKMEGTYIHTGGLMTVDIRSGGKAVVTMMGETTPCTYKVKGDKIVFDCRPDGELMDFLIHDDGSLTGPDFIGTLRKSK